MEKKEVYICNQQSNFEEDEIDLKELFKTIWNYKIFIILFTSFITILALIYAFTRQPVYQTKHTFKLAQIDGKVIDNSSDMVIYLKSIYKNELNKNFDKTNIPDSYINNISSEKGSKLFLNVDIQGISNKADLQKRDEVLKVLQKTNENKIKSFYLTIENNIKDLEVKKDNIKLFEIPALEQNISNIDYQINLKQKLVSYANDEIKIIKKKITFLNTQIENYSKELLKVNKSNLKDDLVISNKILSYKTLLNDYKSELDSLSLKQKKLITEVLPNISNQIVLLKKEKEVLKKELKILIPKKISDIEYQIKQLELSKQNTFNVKEVGKGLVLDHPIKPKKKLIVIVAFMTSLILAIFLVFFIEFIKGLKEEEK